MVNRKSGSRAVVKYWPQLLATGLALIIFALAYQNHKSLQSKIDEELETFLNEIYFMQYDQEKSEQEDVAGDYFLDLID